MGLWPSSSALIWKEWKSRLAPQFEQRCQAIGLWFPANFSYLRNEIGGSCEKEGEGVLFSCHSLSSAYSPSLQRLTHLLRPLRAQNIEFLISTSPNPSTSRKQKPSTNTVARTFEHHERSYCLFELRSTGGLGSTMRFHPRFLTIPLSLCLPSTVVRMFQFSV